MNLQEFAALKVGDQVENRMTDSKGVVTEQTDSGVRVHWGAGASSTFTGFLYTAQSTAWMHWSHAD